jgi:hypothetical protein
MSLVPSHHLLLAIVAATLPVSSASTWNIITARGDVQPGVRWGHTITPLGGAQFLICGGANWNLDLVGGCYLLNSSTYTFAPFMDAGTVHARGDHSAVIFHENLLVLYGGNCSAGLDPTLPLVYNLDSRSYVSTAVIAGDPPAARWGHTGVFLPGSETMMVFGGATEDDIDQGDLIALVLTNDQTPAFEWQAVSAAGNPPPSRHYHAAAVYGEYEMVIAGGTNSGGTIYTDVFVLSYSEGAYTWYSVPAVRAIPQFGHVAVLVGTMLVVYGGSISSNSAGGNVRTLDISLSSPVWQDMAPGGSWLQTPFRASGSLLDPTSADFDSYQLLVYGGVSIDGFLRTPPQTLALLTQVESAQPGASHDVLPIIVGVSVAIIAIIGVAMFFVWRYGKAQAAAADAEAAAQDDGDYADEDDDVPLSERLVTPVSVAAGREPRAGLPATADTLRSEASSPFEDADEQKINFSSTWD